MKERKQPLNVLRKEGSFYVMTVSFWIMITLFWTRNSKKGKDIKSLTYQKYLNETAHYKVIKYKTIALNLNL